MKKFIFVLPVLFFSFAPRVFAAQDAAFDALSLSTAVIDDSPVSISEPWLSTVTVANLRISSSADSEFDLSALGPTDSAEKLQTPLLPEISSPAEKEFLDAAERKQAFKNESMEWSPEIERVSSTRMEVPPGWKEDGVVESISGNSIMSSESEEVRIKAEDPWKFEIGQELTAWRPSGDQRDPDSGTVFKKFLDRLGTLKVSGITAEGRVSAKIVKIGDGITRGDVVEIGKK